MNSDICNQKKLLKARTERFFWEKGKIKIYSDISNVYNNVIKMYIILLLKNFQESICKIWLCTRPS